MNDMVLLDVRDLHHRYAERPVLRGVSFSVRRGALACLLGPSGCGKTTLLRLVSGFEVPAAGEVWVDNMLLSAPARVVPPERRGMGMVFQDFALFPHLDVGANVAFGLANLDARSRAARVAELLELVGLPGAERRFPHQLSGGQQQRVALARALAPRPRLVLLDEPFSGLDSALRESLAAEVSAILRREGTTALMVTHDQREAFALADVVGVMHEGLLEQWAPPEALYRAPATRFVAGFVGEGVLLPGRRCEGGVRTALGVVSVRCKDSCDRVDVLLRPDDLEPAGAGASTAVVDSRTYRGAQALYALRLDDGSRVHLLLPGEANHPPGTRLGVRVNPARTLAAFPS